MSWRLKRVDDVNDLLEEMRDTDERERERGIEKVLAGFRDAKRPRQDVRARSAPILILEVEIGFVIFYLVSLQCTLCLKLFAGECHRCAQSSAVKFASRMPNASDSSCGDAPKTSRAERAAWRCKILVYSFLLLAAMASNLLAMAST